MVILRQAIRGRWPSLGFLQRPGNQCVKMLLVEYDILASRPKETIDLIYDFIEEAHFAHDFDNVEYSAEDYDTAMIAKGLHRVKGRVEFKPRPTISSIVFVSQPVPEQSAFGSETDIDHEGANVC
jgi:hypothetical protein